MAGCGCLPSLFLFFSFGYGACDACGAGPVLVVAKLWSYFWRAAGSPKVSSALVHQMGVSKNRGIPKWMVYNGKPY